MDNPPIWTQQDLIAISQAISAGVLEVRFANGSARYNTTADLLKARQAIQSYLDSQTGTVRIRQTLLYN
ncbi:MAG TPA: hypothetical protein VGN17_00485 [Bryobacteraceae bacterium]|jgi:hypothetical protein